MSVTRSIVALGASLMLAASVSAGSKPSFTPLGALKGYDSSVANAVSGNGRVVVGISTLTEGELIVNTAFRWTMRGGMVPLPTFEEGEDCFAYAVSYDGSHVVGSCSAGPGTSVAVRWKYATGIEAMEDLDPDQPGFAEALAISADGNEIAGIVDGCPCGMFGQGFLWSRREGMRGLGWLNDQERYSRAAGMSAGGEVVVGEAGPFFGRTAFRWTESSGMWSLGAIQSRAEAVSADGTTIVGAASFDSGLIEAFRWTKPVRGEGGMVGLGDLPGGGVGSEALSVSADGSVIVGFADSEDGGTAAVWYGDAGPFAVQDLLEDAGLDLTGWQLTVARGVSWDGRTIVGVGSIDGVEQAWVAYLPLRGD